MKKRDKFSDNNSVYAFSFILRKTNPLEKVILDKLSALIESGCTQKDAIMTLMSMSIIDSSLLDAVLLEDVQSKKKNTAPDKVVKNAVPEKIKNMSKETIQAVYKPVDALVKDDVSIVKNKPADSLNNDDRFNTPEAQAKLQSLLHGMYKG